MTPHPMGDHPYHHSEEEKIVDNNYNDKPAGWRLSARDRKRLLEKQLLDSKSRFTQNDVDPPPQPSVQSLLPPTASSNNESGSSSSTTTSRKRIKFAAEDEIIPPLMQENMLPDVNKENKSPPPATKGGKNESTMTTKKKEEEEEKNNKKKNKVIQISFKIQPNRSLGIGLEKRGTEGIYIAQIDETVMNNIHLWNNNNNSFNNAATTPPRVGMKILSINGRPCPDTVDQLMREIVNIPIGSDLIMEMDSTITEKKKKKKKKNRLPIFWTRRRQQKQKEQEYTSFDTLLEMNLTTKPSGAESDVSSSVCAVRSTRPPPPVTSILKQSSTPIITVHDGINEGTLAWDYDILPSVRVNDDDDEESKSERPSYLHEEYEGTCGLFTYIVNKVYLDCGSGGVAGG